MTNTISRNSSLMKIPTIKSTITVLLFSCLPAFSQVNVHIRCGPRTELIAVPNPSMPNTTHEPAGVFHLSNNPKARDWVRSDNSGIVFTFHLDEVGGSSVNASFSIMDSYNSSIISENGTLTFPGLPADTECLNIDLYWNGTKSNGEIAHVGTYYAALKISNLEGTGKIDLKSSFYFAPSGYGGDTLSNGNYGRNTCGSGYSIAFLPAIWLKSRKPLLRIIKNILKKSKMPC